MLRHLMVAYFFMVLFFPLCASGCRPEGGSPSPTRHDRVDTPQKEDAAFKDQSVQHLTQRPWNENHLSGHAPPPAGEAQPYVNGVYAYAGCVSDGTQVTVAAHHENPGECERVVLTSYYAHGGEMEEWAVPFVWGTTDPNALSITCLNGPNDNFCWPVGLQDIFDTEDELVPHADIIACALNTCPNPQPVDCFNTICNGFSINVAVNVEGAWLLKDELREENLTVTFTQDGQAFEDQAIHLRHGIVEGAAVSFEMGDYGYSGTITADRLSMNGVIMDLLGGNPAGTWSAARLAPSP